MPTNLFTPPVIVQPTTDAEKLAASAARIEQTMSNVARFVLASYQTARREYTTNRYKFTEDQVSRRRM